MTSRQHSMEDNRKRWQWWRIKPWTSLSLTFTLLIPTLTAILSSHTHAQSPLQQQFTPITASANDLRLLFTPDFCGPDGGAGTAALQPFDDPTVFLVTCPPWTGILIWRWNQTVSTMLIFPQVGSVPTSIAQHPVTAEIFFTLDSNIYSFMWNQSTQQTFEPPLKLHAYNHQVCPYLSTLLGIVFSPDGSHLYVGCCAAGYCNQDASFLAAIYLNTTQTIAINTTWEQSHDPSPSVSQNITQLSLIEDTNQLIIVSGQYGVTLYDTNQTKALLYDLDSTLNSKTAANLSQPRVILDASACSYPYEVIVDLSAAQLMAVCFNQTIIWNLTSNTNISVDPFTRVIIYPQTPSQTCGGASLLYHRPKRTLYQSCANGPDRVFALQNLNSSQSILFTSLVSPDTCSSSRFLMTDRTQPDVLFSMCAEGMMRMEGRAVTPIHSGQSSCLDSLSTVYYDWRTDSTYAACSPAALMRIRNNQAEPLLSLASCANAMQLMPDQENNKLYVSCFSGLFNMTLSRTTIWAISLSLSPSAPPPYLLFILPGVLDVSMFYRGMFYSIVDDMILWTFNTSTPDLEPQPTSLLVPLYALGEMVGCEGWLFISNFTSPSIIAIPVDRIGLEQPKVVYHIVTLSFDDYLISNLICDAGRKILYAAFGTPDHRVELLQINITQVELGWNGSDNSSLLSTFSFDTDRQVSVFKIALDTTLNRVYLIIQPGQMTPTPLFFVVYHVDTNRFLPGLAVARELAPSIGDFIVDSYTSQVLFTIVDASDNSYNQVVILSSGFRCTTGTSWYQGICQPCPLAESRSAVLSTIESTYSIPQCVACGSGSIANVTGTIECTQCAQGRYADPDVGQVCSLCVGGSYSNQTGSTACQPCESGRYSNVSEASSCWPADPGSYVSVAGQSMQFQCPSGRFTNTLAATTCQPCDAGRYAADYGTSNCTETDPGSYQLLLGQNSPLSCPSGRYSNTSGATFCHACVVGTFSSAVGTIKCGEPSFGYYVDQQGQASSQPCATGRFTNITGASSCYTCDTGKYAASFGQSFCHLAGEGYYISLQGQSAQIECPPGRYSNTAGAVACLACDLGRYAAAFGSKNCMAAAEGFFVDQPGQNSPQPCRPGTFNNVTGSTSCQACASGRFASLPSSILCTECLLGQFSAAAASNCPTCSADAYTPQKGAQCISCTDQEGLICINGLASVAAGWWPYLVNDTSFDPPLQVYRTTQCPPGYCDGATLQFASSSTNQTSQLCTSPRLNSASNWLCAECEDGYIAWGSSCEPCTGPDVGLICGALILTFIIAYVLLRIDPAASPLTILFFFVQIAALEVGSVTQWLDWIQFANLSAHSFQRCLAPLTPAQQMILTLCIPFLLVAVLGIIGASHRLISKYVTPSAWYQAHIIIASQPSRFTRFVAWCSMSYDRDRYLGAINAILIFCYTPVTVTVVSALHCVDVGPDVSRLFSSPSIDCHSTEYRALLLPFVYVWLCCYVIGLPIFMLIFVWWRWQTVASILATSNSSLGGEIMERVDGHLSPASSSLNDSSSSVISVLDSGSLVEADSSLASSHSFDARWGHFYRRYRLTAWYWQPIEMLQRFAFALTSVLLIKNSRARYSMYSTISILSLSANLWSHPFASERMNQVALIAYFLLSFVSFLLNGQEPPYSLTTQLMFFGLIVPFSIILFIWGVRLNVMGLKKYMKTSDGRIVLAAASFLPSPSSSDPRLTRSVSAIVTPMDPPLHRHTFAEPLLQRSSSVRL